MGWGVKKLGDICENLDNRRVPITKKNRVLGEIPYYGASGIVDYVKDYIFDEDLLLVSEDGANLLARTYPIAFSVSGKTWVNNHAHTLKFDESTTQRFVEYYLNSISLRDFISGMAQPKLNQKSLNSIPVPVPPLPEQKRIVALLDTVFADLEQTRAKTEQNLKNARELFDSYLQQVFSQQGDGWTSERLENICTFSSGGTPSKKNENYWNGDIPWVSGRDMKSTQLSDTFLHISECAVEEGSARLAPKGTLLTLVRGMGLAHGAQVAELMVPSAFNQDIKGLHLNSNIVPRYLVFVLRQIINSSADIISSAAHGTLKINMDALKNVVVPVPPTVQQQHIVDRLDAFIEDVDSLESIYQKKLFAIDGLKKSILQKTFSGELTKAAE